MYETHENIMENHVCPLILTGALGELRLTFICGALEQGPESITITDNPAHALQGYSQTHVQLP